MLRIIKLTPINEKTKETKNKLLILSLKNKKDMIPTYIGAVLTNKAALVTGVIMIAVCHSAMSAPKNIPGNARINRFVFAKNFLP